MLTSTALRYVIIATLGFPVLGAAIASAWHDALFHVHVTDCDHIHDHDHEHSEEQEGRDREECALCDFFFYGDLPAAGIPTIDAPLTPEADLLLVDYSFCSRNTIDIYFSRGPPGAFIRVGDVDAVVL